MLFSISLFAVTSVFCQTQTDSLAYYQHDLANARIDVKNDKAKLNDAQKFKLGRIPAQRDKDIERASFTLQMDSGQVERDKAAIYRLKHTTHKIPAAKG